MIQLSHLKLAAEESLRDFLKKDHPIRSDAFHIQAGLEWLCRAQDESGDNGTSAWFSLITGWQPSYIETTGYIINTFFAADQQFKQLNLRKRALKMADFLVAMQHKLGGYRTVVPSRGDQSPPTVFNTGQDLLGLTEAYSVTKDVKYLNSVKRAANFLLSIQEPDGSWLKYTYGAMKHTYHTRVAWGILKVWQLTKEKKYLTAGVKSLDWAAEQQLASGWFAQNHLPQPNPSTPYTHTIAYAIEGFLWSGLLLKNDRYLELAADAALPLAQYYLDNNFLPGTFEKNWSSSNRYTCLTGDAQLALVWLELFKYNHNETFFEAAHRMLDFLKSTQPTEVTMPAAIRGAIKGSYPIYGDLLKNQGYCRLAYLNWSTKFFIDALLAKDSVIKSFK